MSNIIAKTLAKQKQNTDNDPVYYDVDPESGNVSRVDGDGDDNSP
jgi:hypothetical protein